MAHKRWTRLTIALLLTLFGIFTVTAPALAEEEAPYTITGYTSHITLNSDGSAYFDESITYRLLKESVEIIKPIPMAYSSRAEGMEVFIRESAVSEATETDPELKPLQQTSQPSGGGGSYTFELAVEEGDIYHITIPVDGSKREEVTFVYRYKMMDTVFLYKDTAAFFWQFLLPDQGIEVQNLQVEVSIPEVTSMEDWDGYARGAAYVQKELLDNGIFRITAERIRKGEFLESVLLLPNSLFPEGRKIIDNYAEDEIASDMAQWEDQASRARKEEELKLYGGWAIALLAALLCVGTSLLLYLKTRTKKGIPVPDSCNTDIPDASISPAELGVLMNGGKAGARELFTTVLSLIQSRYLELQHKENNEAFLVLREDISKNKLKPHEEYVLNWLMADLGNGHTLSLAILDQILAGYDKTHKNKISTWKALIVKRTKKWSLTKNITGMKAWAMGAAVISLLAGLLAGVTIGNRWAGLLAGVFALALAGYVIPLKKVSRDGMVMQAKWLKYRDELKGQLNDQQNQISLYEWEERFLYAVPLGFAGEILEKLPGKFKENAFEDGRLTILYSSNHQWLARTLEKLK